MIVTPIPTTILSVPKNKVQNHSQTLLNPEVFLKIRQRRFQRIFVETHTPYCKSSVLQKYFGKKVLYVTNHSDLVHTISSRKFADEIMFSSRNVEKYKCLDNRIFLGDSILLLRKKEYGKLISTSISKITMDFYHSGAKASNLKSIRPFAKNIKHLNLRLPTSRRGRRDRRRGHSNNNFFDMEYLRIVEMFFPMLDKLEIITLRCPSTYTKSDVNDDEYVQQMEVFLDFLQKIVKLKKLRRINLDLFMGVDCQFLKDVLFCLDTSHIENWHFRGFFEQEMLDVNAIGPLLEKIDFLGLKFTNSLNTRKYPDYMPPDLREMPELTAKRKKVLDLEMMYDDVGPDVELAEILSHGKSLEGLYIKSLYQDRINWKITDLTPLAQVKDLVLIWDKNQFYRDTIDDGFLKDFLFEFKEKNSGLQSLKIFFRSAYEDDENDFVIRWTIPTYITDLHGMKSLEELTLYSDGKIDKRGNAFNSLTSLKRFTLHLCASNNKRDWWEGFPFNSLSSLAEFRLIIHPDMQIDEWNESFASHISLLPDLEVLEIIDDTNTLMPLCVLYRILKELARFEKLRTLTLRAYIKKLVTKDTLFIIGKKLYKARESKVIKNIKGKILRLISANPKLEKLDIGNFDGYKIPVIFYKKGYIISK